jgi:hypothetical protein
MTKPEVSDRVKALKAFIDDAGGELKVAFELSQAGSPLSQFAVRRWTSPTVATIPDHHWPTLARLANRDAMELYRIHQMPK